MDGARPSCDDAIESAGCPAVQFFVAEAKVAAASANGEDRGEEEDAKPASFRTETKPTTETIPEPRSTEDEKER